MISLSSFDALIFDFGGVILNIDYGLTVAAFQQIGVHSPHTFKLKDNGKNLFVEFEKGSISPMQFREEIRKQSKMKKNDEKIDHAWNALLINTTLERLELLSSLKQKTQLFLLSNSNRIHYDWYIPYINNSFSVNFKTLFEKTYFSFKLGMLKPDPCIYQLVIDENSLNPARTLFIDDSEANIEGAKRVGMQTYWLQVGEEITNVFGKQ